MTEPVTLPVFDVLKERIVYRNPTVLSDGIAVCQEAFLEIDATKMSQDFLMRLMWHMSEGHVRVRVAEVRSKDD